MEILNLNSRSKIRDTFVDDVGLWPCLASDGLIMMSYLSPFILSMFYSKITANFCAFHWSKNQWYTNCRGLFISSIPSLHKEGDWWQEVYFSWNMFQLKIYRLVCHIFLLQLYLPVDFLNVFFGLPVYIRLRIPVAIVVLVASSNLPWPLMPWFSFFLSLVGFPGESKERKQWFPTSSHLPPTCFMNCIRTTCL